MTLASIMTALVIVFQFLGSFIKFGPFSVSLVLVPIVIGAATCGVGIGAWLGFIFSLVVLFSGDAAAFMIVSIPGTIITVIAKGTLCGFAAGAAYKLLSKYNMYLAVAAAAIVCPLVNTGVFLIGCIIFFLDTVTEWGYLSGYGGAAEYIFLGLVGGNFLFELGSNVILSPVIVRLLNIRSISELAFKRKPSAQRAAAVSEQSARSDSNDNSPEPITQQDASEEAPAEEKSDGEHTEE